METNVARKNAEGTEGTVEKATRKRRPVKEVVSDIVNRDLKNFQILHKHLLKLSPEAHEKTVKEYRLAVERLAERNDSTPKFSLDD